MTDTPVSQDLHLFFDDLIDKYSPVYGEGWVERVQPMINRLQVACEQKDLAVLLDLLHRDNPFLREVFSRMTDIALPKTENGLAQVLQEFVGPEQVAAYTQRVDQQRRLRQREELQYKVADRSIRTTDYGVLRMDEFIRRLIADGYTTPREFQMGSAKTYGLFNGQHNGYRFKRKAEYLYMCALLEERQAASSTAQTAPVDPGGD